MEKLTRYITEYNKKFFEKTNKYWTKTVKLIRAREFLAELMGTFMLVLIGDGAIAQVMTSKQYSDVGGLLTINLAYGIALMIALYVSIGVSGGHLNPAVTLAMTLRGKSSWFKVIPYWIAQFLGAFFAAVVVYGVYSDAINEYHNSSLNCNVTAENYKTLCTAGIFATYPNDLLTLGTGLFDQVVGTFVLVVGIFAVCDSCNTETQTGIKPIAIGLIIVAIGSSFGFNSGAAFNPARDFSPRLFTAMAGWGSDVFVCSQCSIRHWWLVPLVVPMLGAAIAAFLYWLFVEAHHNTESSQSGGESGSTLSGKTEVKDSVM